MKKCSYKQKGKWLIIDGKNIYKLDYLKTFYL